MTNRPGMLWRSALATLALTVLVLANLTPASATATATINDPESRLAQEIDQYRQDPADEPGRAATDRKDDKDRKASKVIPAITCDQHTELRAAMTADKPYVMCNEPRDPATARTAAAPALPRPAEIPAWCENFYYDAWGTNRVTGCTWLQGDVILLDRQFKQVGKFSYTIWHVITANPAKNLITWESWIGASDLDGQGYAMTYSGRPTCGGPCDTMTNPWPPAALVEGQYKRLMHEYAGQLSGTTPGELAEGMWPESDVTFAHPLAVKQVNQYFEILTPLRCDYLAAGGDIAYWGCVFPMFDPTHLIPRSLLGEYADHVADAQASGLPGHPTQFGGNYPLHRIMNSDDIQENRDMACADAPSPRPQGKECDEYPFASTDEGAATSGGPFSWRLINATNNQDGGRHLKGFYRDYRIINMDSFYAKVIP